jgi:hypothetical protein
MGGVSNARNWRNAPMTPIKRALTAVAAALVLGATTLASLAASEFEGVWKVTDTAGKPFEITLSADGTAKGTQEEGMTGTWKVDGKTAVITWNTGWTTKITKDGNKYTKSAYKKGESPDGKPANTSAAEKVK